jgi:hypothetical protein
MVMVVTVQKLVVLVEMVLVVEAELLVGAEYRLLPLPPLFGPQQNWLPLVERPDLLLGD